MLVNVDGSPLSTKNINANSPQFLQMISGIGSARTVNGIAVNELTAMQNAVVYTCVKILSESAASIPLRMYKVNAKGERKEERKTKQAKVLQKPNQYQTMSEFIEMAIANLCLRGNFYAYVTKNRKGEVLEILPFPNAGSVSPFMDDQGDLYYSVSLKGGKKELYTSDEILHIKGLSVNGYMGLNPIEFAANSVALSIASTQHGSTYFENSATPSGFLTTQGTLSAEAQKRLKDSWNEKYTGLKNAHRVAVFEQGLEFKPLTISNKDSQYLETRQFQRSEIAALFRIPAHMVGDMSQSTYSNIEHTTLQFYRDTLYPYLSRIVNRLNLMLPDNIEVEFDTTYLLRGDTKTQATVNKSYFEMGALTINEVRASIGMPPLLSGGDERAVSTNNMTLGSGNQQPTQGENEDKE